MMATTIRFLTALCVCAVFLQTVPSQAALTFPFVVDFSAEEDGTPLVNGQAIDDEFGMVFDVSSDDATMDHNGPAIFDTNNPGPNDSGNDLDLLVNLGNALILQNSELPTQTIPGIFDVPNDEANSSDLGFIQFDFTFEVELLSIDLIDVNGGVELDLTLTDANGLTRSYAVPEKWTNEITVAPVGFDTLLLTTLADQDGEGTGADLIQGTLDDFVTATEDAGFDSTSVVSLQVEFDGSAALDNLVIGNIDQDFFIPEPSAAVLTALAGMLALGRRRV